MTSSSLVWYTARASGIVAYLLLTGAVVWGLAFRGRHSRRVARHAWVLDLHRFLGAAAVVFLGVHITSVLLDTYVHFGIADVLVPFLGKWSPGAVAWGITAMYLLVALQVTSLFRARLPGRLWRATHYLAFPLFGMATIHGLTAGTDRNGLVVRGMYLGATAAVTVLTVRRFALEAKGRPAEAAEITPPAPARAASARAVRRGPEPDVRELREPALSSAGATDDQRPDHHEPPRG